jgi:iron complex transport system substrate-binding protein
VAARAQRLIAILALAAIVIGAGAVLVGAPAQGDSAPRRIVSLVPSVTESLFAIGAGPQVVGVGTYDSYPPEVKALPRVGGLVDPNTERILSLRPDLVITYGSQAELAGVLKKAGIRTLAYRHGGVADELRTIRALGPATGHEPEAAHVAADVERRLDAVRARVRARPRPRTLLVIDRQPGTLRDVYVSGGRGFLHDLLEIAGGTDVFADIDRESVQPSTETLLARAPEVILELRAATRDPSADAADARAAWSVLPSLPAVRSGRILLLTGDYIVEPGPRMAQAAEAISRAIHPEAVR